MMPPVRPVSPQLDLVRVFAGFASQTCIKEQASADSIQTLRIRFGNNALPYGEF